MIDVFILATIVVCTTVICDRLRDIHDAIRRLKP